MKGLPEQGQEVYVVAPSGAAINAQVREVSNGATTVEFSGGSGDPTARLDGDNVLIEYTNSRGICRVGGTAHKAKGLGVLRVDHTGKVQLVQRRDFVRIDALIRVTYQPLGATGWTAETTSLNVSGGGFMISGREGLRIDDVMPFTLELDGDVRESGPMVVIGRVVRETPSGLGIGIQQIDERERERLIRWVFARQRLAMQIVRER